MQVAQTAHAVADFCLAFPTLAKEWNTISNYLICLSAKDEQHLSVLAEKCKERGLEILVFREPDVGNEVTAICIEPSEITQKLVSNLPLTLK